MKTIKIFVALLISINCFAQNANHGFIEYSQSFEKELLKELSENNNRQVITLIDNWIDEYRIQEDSVKARFNTIEQIETIKSNCYFEISKEFAISKVSDSSLFYLRKAVDFGFSDLQKIQNDTTYRYLENNSDFNEIRELIERKTDWIHILRNSGGYETTPTILPKFVYQDKHNKHLVELNKYFNLDSIAGNEDEISQILNLLNWTNKLIKHNGTISCYATNAIDIYDFSKGQKEGVNCRAIATFLNECYLAIGLKSRHITCNPRNMRDNDSHVINHVYSEDLKKWLWIDPTFNAYFTDNNGLLLSIPEVRNRIIEGDMLILNNDAMLNGKKITIEEYLFQYMAKNLYWFQCPLLSMYNGESKSNEPRIYVSLYPLEFKRTTNDENNIITSDKNYFWEE
jgi:hypothetical protein